MQNEDQELTLYEDFKLTEENCDKEPINRPRAIQGHGHMLVFDEKNPGYLFAICEKAASVLGKERDALWGSPVKDWMPGTMLTLYEEMGSPHKWDSVDPMPFDLGNREFNIIRHVHAGKRFLEIEPRIKGSASDLSTFRAIRMVTEPLYRIQHLEELYHELARQYKKVTGYDRVMVYKFDTDYHGHVVGEAREEHLEPFLGLHYPATDIPKLARDLFLLNRSRIITDIDLENNWLHFNPGMDPGTPYLDLTYTQLRATSPIHIEYLKNMGVGATFNLAIVIENKLWGLIACHHYSPHFLPFEMRKTGELIANSFAQRIVEIGQNNYLKKARVYFEREVDFLSKINPSMDLGIQLMDAKPDITGLCDADGCAVIISNAGLYTSGSTPGKDTLIQLMQWLKKEGHNEVFHTDHLAQAVAQQVEIPGEIGGMISIGINAWEEIFLLWFKDAQQHIFHWGGDPTQPYEVDYLQNGEIRLSPRKSFEKWKQQVDTKSTPWDQVALDMAKRLREGLLRKEFERHAERAEIVKRDYEQLTYVASHDLQEPLRTVTNYLDLIAQELDGVDNDDFKHYLQRTKLAADRMKNLIKDMLDYSRLGRNKETGWVPVNKILEEVKEDMEVLIKETSATIQFKKLPSVKHNKTELKQLFQNMIHNAIKYRREGVHPLVRIDAEQVGNYWTFSIKDNGIGIEQAYFDRIFLLFQRLHGKDDYTGTGIGLAYCKKIIDQLSGRIWVTSRVGEGSTFWFSLHESIVNNNGNKTPTDLTH